MLLDLHLEHLEAWSTKFALRRGLVVCGIISAWEQMGREIESRQGKEFLK
jgi:hypothetical protein